MSESLRLESHNYEDVLRGDTRVCRACLVTHYKMFDLRETNLEHAFIELTGLPVSGTDITGLVCALCLHLLRKFSAFRKQCHYAAQSLQQRCYGNTVKDTDTHTSTKTKQPKTRCIKVGKWDLESQCSLKGNLVQTDTLHINIQPEDETIYDVDSKIRTQVDISENDNLYHFNHEEAITIDETEENKPQTTFINENISNDYYKDEDTNSSQIDVDDNVAISDIIIKEKGKMKCNKATSKIKQVKCKKIKKDNIANKEKTVKLKKELPDDKKLIKEISERFKSMWRWNEKMKMKMNVFEMFERVYEESVAVENSDGETCVEDPKNFNETEKCLKQEMRIYLDRTKKLSEMYYVDVEFLSVEQQRREMEERRSSDVYRDAHYKCELCCKIFNFSDTYERHSVKHKERPGDVECDICRYRFKNRTAMMSHFHMMHSKKLKCKECGFVNRIWPLAKEHHQWHGGVSTVCDLCNKSFNENKLYYMHLRRAHKSEIATAQCPLCLDSFKGQQGVRIHMDRSHTQAVQCASCEGWFLNSKMLAEHLKTTNNDCRPGHSSCPLCGATFSTEELMKLHHQEKHKDEHKCGQCNESFAGLREYRWHVESKHANYRRRAQLAAKLIKRQGKYVCDICGKDFRCLSILRTHQRTHSHERPYQCPDCSKSFKDLGGMKAHSMSHSGERRHQCARCPKAFRHKSNLNTHMLTHTKEKPHTCPICSKKFGIRCNMEKHVRNLHKGCPIPQRTKLTNTDLE